MDKRRLVSAAPKNELDPFIRFDTIPSSGPLVVGLDTRRLGP